MFCHILGAENLEGTIAERRICDVIKTGKNFLYKPRSAGGSALHKHPDKLSETQMQMMMDKLEFYLHFFGYASNGEEPFDGTDPSKAKFPINCGFYNYHGKAKYSNVDAHMGFLKMNEEMLKKRMTSEDSITINGDNDGFDMVKSLDVLAYDKMIKIVHIR